MKSKLYVYLVALASLSMACQSKDHRVSKDGYGAGEMEANSADNASDNINASNESLVKIKPDSGVVGLDSAEMTKNENSGSAQDPDAGRATSIIENSAGTSQSRGKENNSPSRQMPQTNKPQGNPKQ